MRCSRSYDKTYFDQQDHPQQEGRNFPEYGALEWLSFEEGMYGWEPMARQIGDSSCDSTYNIETCLYDMGDCCLPGRYTIERYNLETPQTWTNKYRTIHFSM